MFYAVIFRVGEPSQYWSFAFTSKKVYSEAVNLLNAVKAERISTYKFTWDWKRWTLETRRLSNFPKAERPFVKDSPICQSPEDVLTRIERLHAFWDAHIPLDGVTP